MGTAMSPAFEVEFNPVKSRVVSSLFGKPEDRSSTPAPCCHSMGGHPQARVGVPPVPHATGAHGPLCVPGVHLARS